MRRFDRKRMISLALAACLLLSCAACGGEGEARAASMWLVKTEGTVSVTDGEGGDVSLLDRLGLFSGYGVATQAASFGWIDLDDTKLTKMDENSGVTVQKDGKHLELTVDRGSLFFNVTRPLGNDESFEIRSSTMVTAIRGTCGWVEVPDAEHMNVYILEGTVECSVGDVTESVTAGQTAAIDAQAGAISVKDFTENDIPAFVAAEVEEDPDLADAIQDASGLDMESGLRQPGRNAYGATTFEQREDYIPFEELPAEKQTMIQEGLQANTAEDRSHLAELCAACQQETNSQFFTAWDEYKVYVLIDHMNGDPMNGDPRLTMEFRPENGMGYASNTVVSETSSGSSLYQCPCENWQWNGEMMATDKDVASSGSATEITTTGQFVDGLRQGTFHKEVVMTVNGETRTRTGEGTFTDGRGIIIRTDDALGDSTIYAWGIIFNLGEAPEGEPLTQYQLDMLYW